MLILIDLVLKCGLREQEAEFLTWDDIHWTDKVLRVRGKLEWGFQVKDCEQRDLKRLANKAGLNCGKCKGCKGKAGECEEWTLHKFRRTYGTTLLRNGINLRTVQRFMGHSDLESTMRYLRPASGEAAQAAVNAIQWG